MRTRACAHTCVYMCACAHMCKPTQADVIWHRPVLLGRMFESIFRVSLGNHQVNLTLPLCLSLHSFTNSFQMFRIRGGKPDTRSDLCASVISFFFCWAQILYIYLVNPFRPSFIGCISLFYKSKCFDIWNVLFHNWLEPWNLRSAERHHGKRRNSKVKGQHHFLRVSAGMWLCVRAANHRPEFTERK